MLQLFRKTKSESHEEVLHRFFQKFYQEETHFWIIENKYIKANFDEFFERLSVEDLKLFLGKQRLLFLPSSGRFSCTFQSMNDYIIIVFPELMSLLKSSATNHALAILAHEMGHIIHNHSKREIDPVKAQVEADLYACKLGFSDELETFLLDQADTMEKRIRLTYVTAYIMNPAK